MCARVDGEKGNGRSFCGCLSSSGPNASYCYNQQLYHLSLLPLEKSISKLVVNKILCSVWKANFLIVLRE